MKLIATYGFEPPACKTSISWPKRSFRVEKRYLHLPNPPTKMTYCNCGIRLCTQRQNCGIASKAYLGVFACILSDGGHLVVHHLAYLADNRVEGAGDILVRQCELWDGAAHLQ